MKLPRKPITKIVSILLSFIMIMGLFSVIPPSAFAASGVNYIYRSWNGEKVVEEVRTCTSYTSIDSNSLTLSSGWYVVKNSMDLSHARIMVNGDVSLILCDGATLTDNKGINVGPESSLSIYGQSGDTGKLYIHVRYHEDPDAGNNAALIGGTSDAGNISIYGGTIDLVTGYNNHESYHGAGIGGGKNGSPKQIKIYGGFIKCETEGNDSACIGGGSGAMASSYDGEGIVIYGGELNLRSSDGAAIGNGKDRTGSTGSIGIYGGTITARSSIGAGIGGGENGGNGPVNIYGGYVTAVSGARESGAGIGGGASASQNAPIRILGGTVVASAKKGAGIGGGKESNGGEIEIAHANVISSSSGGGAGIGGGIKGSSSNVHIHSDAVVCSISTTTKSHQAFADLLNMCVGDAKMKSDASTYGQASVCALSLLIDWFDPEFSGCAIGGGNEGSGGTITIEDSRVYAYCGKRAAVIGGGKKRGFDSITISGSEVFARNKPFEDDEDVLANLENETKDRIKEVIDGVDGAAIGTGDEAESGGGTITIKNHSDVTAIAGTDAAGIGTGDESDVTCTINISDSKVEAHGGRYGAGIGGGDGTDSGNITINASDITADSATDGAGIGGGESGKSNTITITDSTVTARGGGYAAGIGGGDHADGGTTIISQSTVRAYGGTDAAGIGGGEDGDGGHIEIYDSDVYAQGKAYGAGIGGGEDEGVTYVTISGTSRVEAIAGSDGYSVAIGHGDYNSFAAWVSGTPSNGTLRLSAKSQIVKAGADKDSSVIYSGSNIWDACRTNKYACVYICDHQNSEWQAYDVGRHGRYCTDCGTFMDELDYHTFNDGKCTVCGATGNMTTATFIEKNNDGEVIKTITYPEMGAYRLPVPENIPDGMEFVCWEGSDGYHNDPYLPSGEYIVFSNTSYRAIYLPVVDAVYIDRNGVEQIVTAKRLTTDKLCLPAGWYIVDDDLTVGNDICTYGDISLILADDKTLSCSGEPDVFKCRTNQSISFDIYGQYHQSGIFNCPNGSLYLYDFTQYGANLNINRIIASNDLKLAGGSSVIRQASAENQVTLGWTRMDDSIRINSFLSGNPVNFIIADGQALKDENETIYQGTQSSADMVRKTLTPKIIHTYGNPIWTWEDDCSRAKALFTCTDSGCDNEMTVNAAVSYEDRGAYRDFSAICELNGNTYTDKKSIRRLWVVRCDQPENGRISADVQTALPDTTVTVTVDLSSGYALKSINVVPYDESVTVETTGNTFKMPASDVTVSAQLVECVPRKEPYIDEQGEYHLGNIAYYESEDGVKYAVNDDGTIGDPVDSIELCYFTFESLPYSGCAITHYTGPTDNLTELKIPKTYQGRRITELGDGSNQFFDSDCEFELVLPESISKINAHVFENLDVTKVSGDTDNLSEIGERAFGNVNASNDNKLDFTLKYPYSAFVNTTAFESVDVTLHIYHSMGYGEQCHPDRKAKSITYEMLDEHTFDSVDWTWASDCSSAEATLHCGGSLCGVTETVTASDITAEDEYNTLLYTAKAQYNGKTYTGKKRVDKTPRRIQVIDSDNGTVSLSSGGYTVYGNVYANNEINIDAFPSAGYRFVSVKVVDIDNNPIPVTDNKFIMPDKDVTISAVFISNDAVHVEVTEPYIDENGAYVLGVKEHYEFSGKNYAVNEDGSLGEELSDISLSYFEFKLNGETYQINRYTGPAINGKLIIPKTFNGKKITVLGNDEQENLYNRDKTQFELVLNENITEIKPYTFYLLYVTKLSGDTSGLSKLGKYAFSWANSPGGYTLDIKLDYPGMITAGYEMFNNMYVTARVKHATTFSSSQLSAKKIDYIFTDDHTYGNPIWTWSDDNSAATAAFTCTDTRCNHQETVDATITRGEAVEGKVLLTASVEVNGTTYTNEKEVFADSMGARLVGHSISLDGDIAVNFYMELSDSVIAHKDTAYMHFTIPVGSGTTEQKMLVKDALIKEWNGKDYYVFKCSVAAKEMTSEIKAQMIDGDQNGTEYIYSVKEYADYLIEHADEREDLAAAVPLVKKMLNYGAYAQIYFDKNPGTLANEIMDETEKELGDVTITAPETAFDLPAGVTFGGATLSLKSETTLSIYFKSNTTLTFSCGDYTVETAASGGYQIARIRVIKAKHIGDTFNLTVNGGTVTYSPLNYCNSVLPDSTASPDEAQNQQDENLQNVVKALYQYWQAADAYFPE